MSLTNIGLAQVMDNKPLEIDRLEGYQIPGRLAAEGSYFELNNSEYLNITVMSSKQIKIILGSMYEVVTIHIEPVNNDTSTQMTLGGFLPQTTYRKYEDDHNNVITFTTDTNGTYTYKQDLSKPHLIIIRTEFIPKDRDMSQNTTAWVINDNETGGDCTCIGNWDSDNKTCTLTTNLTDTIQIDSDNIILDGNGHVLSGNGTGYGVVGCGDKNKLTIRNLEIKNFRDGIRFDENIRNSTITDNTIINSGISGIFFYNDNTNNTISHNIINGGGICLFENNKNNTITRNTIVNNEIGILFNSAFNNNNTISYNDFSNNTEYSIRLDYDFNNTIIDNNINEPTINYYYGIFLSYGSKYNLVTGNNISNASICEWDTARYNTIINNTISGGGIAYNMGGDCSKIINNKIINSYSGIDLWYTYDNIIVNNTILNSTIGISIGPLTCYSTVISNNILNNEYGIHLYGSLDYEEITNNKIINNKITNNDYGIYIQNAFDNLIYQNNLDNNSIYNAYEYIDDNNLSNQWDNGTIGNHWSDYDEPCEGCIGTNIPGICDSPYNIPVGSGVDNFPLISWGIPVSIVSFSASNFNLPLNSSQKINLTLDSAPNGLSGYNITISLPNPSVAEIISVEFPDWVALNSTSSLPGDSVWLTATDLNSQIENGAVDVPLATLTVRGDQTGNSNILITVASMDDDNGDMINTETVPSQLEVIGVIPFPGCVMAPTDPDFDGLYEDINGNGVIDFNDIVIFFTCLDWVSNNEPIKCFDFNENDRIDFDDVVKLFKEL
ncbi:MAG: right-handed parallel beta-helix repeat-containing protein [Methanosarcinales archaeon]|nr:right-handed parallel beta-helix repeat-containing protein [Methanosarcinales archaeon]